MCRQWRCWRCIATLSCWAATKRSDDGGSTPAAHCQVRHESSIYNIADQLALLRTGKGDAGDAPPQHPCFQESLLTPVIADAVNVRRGQRCWRCTAATPMLPEIFAHSCDRGCRECTQGTEMLAMHRHGELLGGNEEERLRRERAAREHATALDAQDGMAARRDRSVGKLLVQGPAGGPSGPYSIY